MDQQSIDFFCPFLLYAETHFRFFKGFPSFLYQKDPEILFDCPRRLDPGESLPIVFIINDLQNSSIIMDELIFAVNKPGIPIKLHTFSDIQKYEMPHAFSSIQKTYLFHLERKSLPDGLFFINCKILISINGHKKEILNDNFRTSSKAPLSCVASNECLPGKTFCLSGDMHFHSQYSHSHVEFGPPLQTVDNIAKASGLDFVTITDHSYDLASKMDNYLLEDLTLKRWNSFQEQVQKKNYFTLLIPGEEISCHNDTKNVVHLCGIGISEYIPGSMDGARGKKLFTSQLTIKQSVTRVNEQGGLAYAAHPGSKKSLLQLLFLNRGTWSESDIINNSLDGVQAFNGSFKQAWERGKQLWIRALMKGKKIALLAGNDAHGDFNRYRAIKVPFLSIFENFNRYLGYGKTGVYAKTRTQQEVIEAIRYGKTFITTGPYLSICYNREPTDIAISNLLISTINSFSVHAISTEEFGTITSIALFGYQKGNNNETILFSKAYDEEKFEILEQFELYSSNDLLYIRAETKSRKKDAPICEAYTSPCYFH
jgi:histidinol phosphatase-like PHP family hydrolase